MLCQRECCHTGQQHVQHGTQDCHKQGVEQIAGEGHPQVGHQLEQLGIVLRGGAHHIQPGRELEQLLRGLQGLDHRIVQGEGHERAQQEQQEDHKAVADFGSAVLQAKPLVRNFLFHWFHLLL